MVFGADVVGRKGSRRAYEAEEKDQKVANICGPRVLKQISHASSRSEAWKCPWGPQVADGNFPFFEGVCFGKIPAREGVAKRVQEAGN